MPDRPDVTYRYDGSFEGLLCCVFESYEKKEVPADVLPPDAPQLTLFAVKEIGTDPQKARRVQSSIPRKMGAAALEFVRHAFLTCFARREVYILRFLRLGYRVGPHVMQMLTDDTVHTLDKAVRHLLNESHLLKGFVRFSDLGGALAAQIEPKNRVLPLLAGHFCARYPHERFLIYDRTHGMVLVYDTHRPVILPVEELSLPEPDAGEQAFRELWRIFYNTIEVQGRHNPRCRMGHMPKRYWNDLTEFGEQSVRWPALREAEPLSAGERPPEKTRPALRER